MERLDEKRIIVTGGTSGMGEGIVRAFPGLGAKVVFWGRNEKAGAKIAEETGALFVKAEVSDKASVDEAMKRSVELLGGVDEFPEHFQIAVFGGAEGGAQLQKCIRTVSVEGGFRHQRHRHLPDQ